MKKRYLIEFSYDGSAFSGYQIQPNAPTVQESIEEKLSLINGSKIEIVGSSRTDAGVHAKQQFAHFDLEKEMEGDWLYRLNKLLPSSLAVHSIKEVKEDFHARFDAISRKYEYHIVSEKNPFLFKYAYWFGLNLDFTKMNEAANLLLKYEDFECFSKVHTDVFTFNCTIKQAYWEIRSPSHFVFHIESNRFLRGMVRAIVGTLLEIGQNRMSLEDFIKIIESKDRSNAGRAVPGHGLFLTEVNYKL